LIDCTPSPSTASTGAPAASIAITSPGGSGVSMTLAKSSPLIGV
jgi:hypothetical protein